jgi:glutathione reductase (NADPH)
MAARYGARVAVAEERYLGGTCVNVGCVPKKLLVYASEVSEELADARSYGWSIGKADFDWRRLIANKDREIARLNGVYRQLLEGARVEVFDCRARLQDAHTVTVGERQVRARHILVATGSRPYIPQEVPGTELALSSDDLFHLDELPERAVIVGGGYIAVEFASIFNGLGVDTVLLYRRELFLRGFDGDLRRALAEEMRARGIELRFDSRVARIEAGGGGSRRVELADGDRIDADLVLCAVGRRPNTAGLGLEELGVELAGSGAVRVDAYSQSSVPSVWAVGDVTDRLALTPVAIHEGAALAETLFNDNPTAPDHRDVPSAVFCQPAIATVGLSEDEARTKHDRVDVYCSRFRPLELSLTERAERSLVKLVVDGTSDRVLGVHMLGPEAAEVVQGFAVAVKAGVTKSQIDATLGIHPTSAEELVTLREPVPD